jgi:N-sulfoglucosamine sulfohydrolase
MKRILFALAVVFFAASASAAKRPNILFAIADDWGFGHAGAYGCSWVRTPSFDRLAEEGILFTRSYTPNAKCAPSRAIILTGRNSWQLEEAGNHMAIFPAKFGGYVERLTAVGYTTGFTGKGWGPGYANDRSGQPRLITGKPYQRLTAKPPAKGISNRDYAANFDKFLGEVPQGKPWAFWYGTTEPHRGYEYGNGVKNGKKLSDIDHVPAFWPDNEAIRNDMLDYSMEVEHYDQHLGRILKALEKAGQLDNTLIVATSDHGMPFPRAKGQAYDYSNHVPLAIRWPKGIKGRGRVVNDYISHADFAPTFLEAAGVKDAGPIMRPITGRSLFDIFKSAGSGQMNPNRDHVLVGKERHDIGRPNSWGYPIRGIYKNDMLYLQNFETDRWPAGNPETGYLNCDASPTKTDILNKRRNGSYKHWDFCFGKRAPVEMFDVKADRDCVKSLVDSARHAKLQAALRQQLITELTEQGDPRMDGKGDVFDRYPYSGKGTDNFYERYMAGEKVRAGWVSPSDFETEKLD